MADQTKIHDDIKLYTTSDKFYLEPTINPTEILVIDRVSGEAYVREINTVKIPIPANAYKPVCGFLGTIKLISGLYLVVAKYRTLVGQINGHDIYEMAGSDIIPYARSTTHLTSKQIDDNNTYERLLRAALEALEYISHTAMTSLTQCKDYILFHQIFTRCHFKVVQTLALFGMDTF
ncbi:unnamed protein product [Pieris macdunnoughi]|uniref:SAC domain-containing protein n=1 Tax=Pieris macdunnoughi TaxID=345717 RepID=A0A821SHK3_9NEOP|nr:unnamed protein product [Pieris macdunnoughi]